MANKEHRDRGIVSVNKYTCDGCKEVKFGQCHNIDKYGHMFCSKCAKQIRG